MLSAVLKIFASRLSLEAGAGRSGGLVSFGGSSPIPFAAEDFKKLAGEDDTLAQAVHQLEDVVAGLPDRPEARYHLAKAYSLLNRTDDARNEVERVLDLDPDFVPARLMRLDLSRRTPEKKRQELEALWTKHATSAGWERWWLQAERDSREERWSEAAAAYGKLNRLRGQGREPPIGLAIDAYMAQGLALLEAMDHLGAAGVFSAVRVLAAGSIEPDLFLAKAYHLAGETGRAESIFERLFDESPEMKRSETALWITTAYSSIKEFARALDWTARIGDDRIEARLRIFFLLRLGRTTEAIALGRQVVEGDSRDPIAHYLYGLALLHDSMPLPADERTRRLDRIIGAAKQSLNLKKDFPRSQWLLELAEGERKLWMNKTETTSIAALALAMALGGTAEAQEGFFDEPVRIAELSSAASDELPILSWDSLEIFLHRNRGQDFDIWVARREDRHAPFSEPTNLTEVNTPYNDGPAGISRDGLTLYFFSNRPGGAGGRRDLWFVEREDRHAPFGEPTPLPQFNSPLDDVRASMTEDGRELFIDRDLGGDDFEMFVAMRNDPSQSFGDLVWLRELSSAGFDGLSSISNDGLAIFFASNRPESVGPDGVKDFDIYMATRPRRFDDTGRRVPFGPPVNVAYPVNTALIDSHPFISHDWPRPGAMLYFARAVDFGGFFDIYQATWHPDCNGNGVDDIEDIEAGDADDANANQIPDECEGETLAPFLRGDCNDDGAVDIADPIANLGFQFVGSFDPPCLDALDFDDNGLIDIADPISSLAHQFVGGPAPATPGKDACGVDPTEDDLTCESFTICPAGG